MIDYSLSCCYAVQSEVATGALETCGVGRLSRDKVASPCPASFRRQVGKSPAIAAGPNYSLNCCLGAIQAQERKAGLAALDSARLAGVVSARTAGCRDEGDEEGTHFMTADYTSTVLEEARQERQTPKRRLQYICDGVVRSLASSVLQHLVGRNAGAENAFRIAQPGKGMGRNYIDYK